MDELYQRLLLRRAEDADEQEKLVDALPRDAMSVTEPQQRR